MARRSGQRDSVPVDGLLLLDKPPGLTSNQALQRVKRLYRARKAGHTGSLDPAATGMLPLCFGEATKVSAYLLDADKTYRVVAHLGTSTDTGDAEGNVSGSAAVPALDAAAWRRVLDGFLGDSEQVPPMYSALKQGGKRLYELARQGEIVERKPRPIRISAISLLEARGARLVFRVRCTKGTYIRTLVEDVARAAGSVAHTAALHRESVAGFDPAGMTGLATLSALARDEGPAGLARCLLPIDAALGHWPACRLAGADSDRFEQGQPVQTGHDLPEGRLLRAYRADGGFCGVAEAVSGGRIAPRRLFRGRA